MTRLILTLSGSLNGLTYGINLWGVSGTVHGGPQKILLFNSLFTLNSSVAAPITFTKIPSVSWGAAAARAALPRQERRFEALHPQWPGRGDCWETSLWQV